ncbi:PD-(D/E)XK motif protein [Parabacteroides chinchillae]|uniref:PD-(D/E)XK family member n=1 Tax=Parabacteroides chinchillae TaxID=871327 RepID=A0A8G2F1I1_9BACT|nr:PD-(D/E)XK motif protein [Parabacteroides chinchillae]SEF90543.1 Putative PD-(D/E)XK family member [Parabacteroides chinchillae]
MKNKLFEIFSQNFQPSHFIRFGENRDLNLYLGRDDKNNFALEFRGKYVPVKIVGSDVISVYQGKSADHYVLRFSLENAELLEYFCTFCQDLLDSTVNLKIDDIAYKTLCSRYFAWKKLFKPHSGSLSDTEIIGLIGELLFMKEYMIPQWGITKSLESWMGPERSHKDFSTESEWYEIKAINTGKETVRISSIEQLDGNEDGCLAVYCLEKMSPSFSGIKLNTLVSELMNTMGSPINRETLLSKLSLYNFDFSPEYDNFVYSKVGFSMYKITEHFPRLCRSSVPMSISKVQYDIVLSEIEEFKV